MKIRWSVSSAGFFLFVNLLEIKDKKNMHQVKVFDDSGNLKKIISVKSLQKRSDRIIETPSLIRKSGRNIKNTENKTSNNTNEN